MTIIAYRDGAMAADRAAWRGDYVSGFMRKICRLPGGGLAAASGAASLMHWFLHRVKHGMDLDNPPTDPDGLGFGGLMVYQSGELFVCDLTMRPFPLEAPWYALGRSSSFTSGCMAAGSSAEDAVRLTLEWTDAGRGDIQVERLNA